MAFKELRELSLTRAREIMRLPADPDRPDLLRLQTAVIQSVLTATVRVDQSRLRGQQGDRFEEMLAQARSLKREMARPGAA